jgi:hypothetical protein
MDYFSCDECRAIYWKLREAYRAATDGIADRNDTVHKIEDWVLQLNAEGCSRTRETSSLGKIWRRMQKHWSMTGQTLSVLPLPPNAISNPD